MTKPTQPSSTRTGADDGVRRHATGVRGRLVWLVSFAIGLPIVATVLAVLVIRLGAEERSPVPAAPVRDAPAPRAPPAGPVAVTSPVAVPRTPGAVAAAVRRRATREPGRVDEKAAPPPTGRVVGPGPAPEADATRPEIDAADAITALRAEGESEGIAAFGLPGTDPPKPGVLVPEGFELPEGFVRHYQTTDDGQQLPAILMVHPDYDLVDKAGNPVAAPGGIVPPDLAPPGMPIEMLDVPERRTRTNLPE